ncbi:MAG: hypothetical protein QGH59_03695 [Gemmatimonadota bacterium]|nr:hypothetical protein [Gemmatimonadota bacterium]
MIRSSRPSDRRSSVRGVLLCGVLLGGAFLAPAAASMAPCLSADSAAEYQESGVYTDYWKYTIQISWTCACDEVTKLILDLGTDPCNCACDEGVLFDLLPGATTGTPPQCTSYYDAEVLCAGDSSNPWQSGPALAWTPDGASCAPGSVGSGTLTFFSLLPPAPATGEANFFVEFGEPLGWGVVSGNLPDCTSCNTGLQEASWGRVKSFYR